MFYDHLTIINFARSDTVSRNYDKKPKKKKTKNITDVFSEAQLQALSKIVEQTEQRKTRGITLAKEHFVEFMSDILTTNPAAVKTSS